MHKVHVVLLSALGTEFDRVEITVRDSDNCAREVIATIVREGWCMAVGDRVELQQVPE